MTTEPRKVLYPDGDFSTYSSAELRQMIERRLYSSEAESKRIMTEINRRERLGIDDISRLNAILWRRKPASPRGRETSPPEG